MFAKTLLFKSAQLFAALILCFICQLAVCAQGQSGGQGNGTNQVTSDDSDPGTAWTIRQNYFKRFPWAKAFGPQGSDQVSGGVSQGPGSVTPNSGPIYQWPATVSSGSSSSVPTHRDEAITKYSVKTFGYPVSDTQFQVIQRLDDNMMLEEAFDPERWMWLENAIGAIKATSAANSMANLERNQAVGAIGFVQSFLENFTQDSGNVWNKIRDQLFVPMAVLLLLPGAVLTQVRAIVAQGSPVFGDVNPFEGIFRAIVAIFLIPATYLVVNYGIDVANSIAYEINQGYTRVTGGNMFQDAASAQQRAFPIRKSNTNLNQIPPTATSSTNTPTATGNDPWSQLESISFDVGAQNGNQADADEVAPVLKSTQRAVVNGMNGGLAATWNVLCAFQMAYLYYLFCIGPVVAALWVWPTQQLRNAFPSWVEGVITVCFWSLFWNTTVLLMACFKDVGDTGTIIMSALNFLAISCVKNAFDFAGLVKAAGDQIGQQMQKQGGGKGGAASPAAANHHGKGLAGAHGLTGNHPHPALSAMGTGHGDTQNGAAAMHSPAALHAASAALSHGLFSGNSDSPLSQTNNNRTGLLDSSTHTGSSALPPPLANGTNGQHAGDNDKASMPPIDRSHNLASQSGDGRGLSAAPPSSTADDAHVTDPGVPAGLSQNQGHGAAATAGGSTTGATAAHSDAVFDQAAVGRAANGIEVAPPPLSGNYPGTEHNASALPGNGTTPATSSGTDATSGHISSLAPLNGTVPPAHDASLQTNGTAVHPGETNPSAALHNSQLTADNANGHAPLNTTSPSLAGHNVEPLNSPLSDSTAHGALTATDGSALNHGVVLPITAATPASLTNDPAHSAMHANALHPGSTTQPSGHALDQNSMHGLSTLASQSHAGDFHVVDAHTGQSVASGNTQALSHLPADHNLQAVGSDGHLLATYDANHQQWTAAGTHGNVTMGADGNWSAGGHVPVSMDQNGHWAASGTATPYDAHSNSFDVNGHSLPASSVSGNLLTANANHVPSAEATVHALSQPGVADNLSAALHGDQAAQHGFVEAAHAQGLSPETLYHASQGDPLAGASVMGIHAAADSAYAHQVAGSLGVSESTIAGAAHNPIAQAQVVGAEAQHSPQFAHDAAASIGAHSDMLLASAHNPVAAAQVVGAEAQSNAAFAHAVAADLHVPVDMVTSAAHNPIMAAQLVGAEAHANPQFAHALSESMGVNPEMVMQAATNPVLAAQMVGAQAHADAGYAQIAAHEMGISPELLSHTAASPVLAAQVVGLEAHADAQYANFVAAQMHAAPEHIAAMADNPIVAAQAVAYEAQLNHDYGAYVAHALHVEPEAIASALSSTRAASYLAEADVHVQPSLTSFAEHAAAPVEHVASAGPTYSGSYSGESSSTPASVGWSDADSYSSISSYAPSATCVDSGTVVSSADSVAYQQDAYLPAAHHLHNGDVPSYATQFETPNFSSMDPGYAAQVAAHSDSVNFAPAETSQQSYSAQYDNSPMSPMETYAAQPETYIGSQGNDWTFDQQSQVLWSSDSATNYPTQSDSYSQMSDSVPPQAPVPASSVMPANNVNAVDPFVAAAYVANASMTSQAHVPQSGTSNSGADYAPAVELATEAVLLTPNADMAPVYAPSSETVSPAEAAADMHVESGAYYVGGDAPATSSNAQARRDDRESSSRLMTALGRAAAPKAAAAQPVAPPNSPATADVARRTGESLLNQLSAVSRAQPRDRNRNKQLDEQLVELRQVAQQNNWA